MPSDSELLSEYLDAGSQTAFTALVERHLAMVHAAALRQVGSRQGAEEVAQRVFALLADKARSLRGHPALVGWLFTATAFTGARMRRDERRRGHHEVTLPTMDRLLPLSAEGTPWEHTRPVIDQALLELKETDRNVVLLRFFEGCRYSEIATRLGVAENTARMRVDRALERLRRALARRNITSTAAAIGTALAEHAAVAAPAGLAASVATTAISGTAGTAASIALMSSAFAKTALVATAIVVAAGFTLEQIRISHLRDETLRLQAEVAAARRQAGNPQLAPGSAAQDSLPMETAAVPATASPAPPFASPAIDLNGDDPTKALTKVTHFRNVGRASPADAFQTIVWAAAHDDAGLPGMLFLNSAARVQADRMIAELPEAQKTEYGTPEKLAALYLEAQLEGIQTLQLVKVRPFDFETYEIDVASGEGGSGTKEFSLQATPTGWMLKIPATRLARFEETLRKSPP